MQSNPFSSKTRFFLSFFLSFFSQNCNFYLSRSIGHKMSNGWHSAFERLTGEKLETVFLFLGLVLFCSDFQKCKTASDQMSFVKTHLIWRNFDKLFIWNFKGLAKLEFVISWNLAKTSFLSFFRDQIKLFYFHSKKININ